MDSTARHLSEEQRLPRPSRRSFLGLSTAALGLGSAISASSQRRMSGGRPNILFCISDDQSWLHAGAMGDQVVRTPAFDRVAADGVVFRNAYCDAPTCGPSRSAILTGQSIWRLEEAGNIHSTLPSKFATYTEVLEGAGYRTGHTSKGWSPGRLAPGGRTRNPAGDQFDGFDAFFAQQPSDQPFCFWLGSRDPHRPFELGSGARSGKDPARVAVPPHLPDHEVVRNDILDYYVEVERFDSNVGRALALLEESGRLENTIVVVTSDHGMPFPRAKASLYDYGSRVPLAVCWPRAVPKGRTVDDFVSLSDMAPTFLEAAGLEAHEDMTAHSLVPVLTSGGSGQVDPSRDAAFIAMERHDGCRRGGKGYPCRAVRDKNHLYIRNFEPTRWPSGSPNAKDCARGIPYGEIDSSPTKTFMMEHRGNPAVDRLAELAFGTRPEHELYDLREDPGQLRNIAAEPAAAETLDSLRERLMNHLASTGDPRALGKPAPWDHYPYYGRKVNQDWEVDPPA
ncbi:MAG: sulfatase [Bryobacterales bacterium]|nr:sulfatase [Bryobacterales bacterium]